MTFKWLVLLAIAPLSLAALAMADVTFSVTVTATTTQPQVTTQPATQPLAPVLSFTVQSLDGKDVALSQYQGKVLLIVNTASKCGFTPQYAALEKLYEKYSDQGLVILGFPCNQFKEQEPGTAAEIAEFCKSKYGVTFPMFAKIDVNGDNAAPLYKFLTGKETDAAHAGPVLWNFEKFLIGRDGTITKRFRSAVKPDADEVVKAVEGEVAK